MGDNSPEEKSVAPSFASFVEKLAELDVKLPLHTHLDGGEECGCIWDAEGKDVCTVDSAGVLPDEKVIQIASWIVVAVNTCGGFKLEVKPDA